MSTKPTEIPALDKALVDKAVSIWRSGGIVAIPTETVYGLAADASNGVAVAKVYATKSRPQFNPLIIHVADAAMAQRYVQWNERAEKLAAAFWPGPVTLVLRRRPDCPISELVSAGGVTLAVRVPDHEATLQLIRGFGGALAAPSANRSGRVSPTTAVHVREEFGDAVEVIDGGYSKVGIESTVVDCSGDAPSLLRLGTVTRKQVEDVIGPVDVAKKSDILLSPGQLKSHYAPSIPVRLEAISVRDDEALLAFGPPIPGAAAVKNLSPKGDLEEAASNLFAFMRALDDAKYTAIAVMHIPDAGIGEAINDRLKRAAA